MLTDTRNGYGLISILLHWAAAVAIGYLWISGQSIEHSGDSNRLAHIAMGSGLAILLLARVLWRAFSTSPAPLSGSRVLNVVASAVKGLLLLDILIAIATGFLIVWFEGRAVDVFGVWSLPSPFAANHALGGPMRGIHSLSTNLFLPLVGLHVLGALKHIVWDRDGTFGRMIWPRRNETA